MMNDSASTLANFDHRKSVTPIEILLVEDDAGDVLLTQRALSQGNVRNNLRLAKDGVEALEVLRREGKFADAPRPDLILLDLNMPRMDGRQFLEEVKADPRFIAIPIVVLTTSEADRDVVQSYQLQASCFITKPVDLKQFTHVVRSIEDFWLCLVKLPSRSSALSP